VLWVLSETFVKGYLAHQLLGCGVQHTCYIAFVVRVTSVWLQSNEWLLTRWVRDSPSCLCLWL